MCGLDTHSNNQVWAVIRYNVIPGYLKYKRYFFMNKYAMHKLKVLNISDGWILAVDPANGTIGGASGSIVNRVEICVFPPI